MSIIGFIKQKMQSTFFLGNNQVTRESISLIQEKPIRMMDLLRQQELERIDAELAGLQKLPPTKIPQLVPNHGSGVVWRISVPGGAEVFMKLNGDMRGGQSDFVVYVRGLAFYRSWLAFDGVYYSCPLQRDMSSDYKFKDAAACFIQSLDCPIPIANLSLRIRENGFNLEFSEGITRTLWLLANNVEVFPVLCHNLASASLLASKAGVVEPVPVPMLYKQ